jgi:hypothetical protein
MKICFWVNALASCARKSSRSQSISSTGQPHRSTGADRVDNRIRPEFRSSRHFDWEAIRMNSPNEVYPVWRFGLIGL